MALSTTQVNAAFVALLGRAAEGNANAWAVNSADTKTLANTILSVDGKYKDSLEQAKTNEDFVEALYRQVLDRNSDADGKAVWLKALASGTSREELMTKFVAAAKAEDPNLTAFYTSNQQFLESVYSALLNRGVDNSGLETWMNLLQNGVSRAEVVAKIIDAINANKDSDDYAIYNAKMTVADAVTKVFAGPKAGLNAEQNAELNKKLVGIMSSVTSADVTEEVIKSEIANVVGSYGKEAAPLTFKAVTDNLEAYELGNAESATAQTFRGNINLQNADKSTINDKATLKTSNFSDTLVVDVIPSTAGKSFEYSGSQVEKFASGAGITNLTINNGTAAIEKLDNKGISENLKITGAANVSGSVSANLQYLEINTGGNANAKADITVKANLTEYVGKGSGKDEITVSGANNITVDKINTGAGEDKLTLSTSGAVNRVDLGAGNDQMIVNDANASISGATINLGAGEDTFTFNSGTVSGATINGGTGTDTIVLSGDASAIKSLTSFEKISISADSKLSLDAFNGNIDSLKGANLALGASEDNKKLTLDASNATTIDLSKVVKDTGTNVKAASIELTNVGSGATVTLNKDDGISETIKLAAGAENVKISGVQIKTKDTTADKIGFAMNGISGAGTGANVNKLIAIENSMTKDKAYVVTTDNASTDITNLDKDKLKTIITDQKFQFSAQAQNNKAVAFVSNSADGKELTAVYLIDGGTDNASTVADVKLIATIEGADITADTYKVVAGVLEFA